MGTVYARRGTNLLPLLRDLGHYFARFRPESVKDNLYTLLVSELLTCGLASQSVLATLNYEILLSLCAREALLDRSDPSGRVSILPIHGACDLVADVSVSGIVASNFQQIGTTPVRRIPSEELDSWYAQAGSLPPVMCVYTEGKPAPLNHHVIEQLQQRWKVAAEAANGIFVIGAKPWFADAHVWQPIANTQAQVYYVGGRDGDFDQLESLLGTRLTVLGERFGETLPVIQSALRAL